MDKEENDNELLKRQCSKIEEKINEIKSKNLGRVGNIFQMKDVIVGTKKAAQGPNAMRNPKTGELVVSAEEIKKVTLTYCVDNLNNVADEEVRKAVNLRKQVNIMRMNNVSSEGFKLEKEDYSKVLDKFSSKKTKSYDFLLKAGDNYKDSTYKLCKRMIDQEEFPISFRKTILYQI